MSKPPARKRRPRAAPKRRHRLSSGELKTNLVVLAVIVGASLAVLFTRFSLNPPTEPVTRPVTVDAPVAVAPDPAPATRPAARPGPAPTHTTPSVVSTPSVAPTRPAKPTPPPARSPIPTVPSSPPERPRPGKSRGTLIFVFDDAGHNLAQLEPFLRLPFPCTIAVLPGLQYSKDAARAARAAGKEVILHQPMQAINKTMDPGPGAIREGMTPAAIRDQIQKNLAELGPVSGINNHEGSLITADRVAMGVVLDVARESGMYFLDSRTNAKTVAPLVARERGFTIWERAVFLDNIQDRDSIVEAVYTGMKIAERKGAAVMIGHIWSNELAAILTDMYPELASKGFSLSTIARVATDKDLAE